MSESLKHVIREIYSEVMFELAEEADLVEQVMADLAQVQKVLSAEPDFAALLKLQTIKGTEKSKIIRRVFGGRVNELTLDFLSVLARRSRMNFLTSISDKYEALVDVYQQRCLVEVTMAGAPDDEMVQKLKADIGKVINSRVKLSVHVDPMIIGGVVIKKGDRVIDNSIRTILKRAVDTVMERSKIKIKGTSLSENGNLN
jgi:F-type H+-transporting ATPase subunit delta